MLKLVSSVTRAPVPDGIVHIFDPGGHRASYRDFFARQMEFDASTGKIDWPTFIRLLRAKRLLFATIDGDLDRFLLIGFLRAICFRRTCGIIIGPLRLFNKQWAGVLGIRRLLFSAARYIRGLTVLTIYPFEMEPRTQLVAKDWIHDPQLWDLWVDGTQPVIPTTDLSRRVKRYVGNRKVIVFLGAAKAEKGFRELVDFAERNSDTHIVIAAGRVQSNCHAAAERLRQIGGVVEDRVLTDAEFLSLFGVADNVWCRYSPRQRGNSGIFGRAVQLGVMPIVHEQSFLFRFACASEIPVAVVDGNSVHVNASEGSTPTLDEPVCSRVVRPVALQYGRRAMEKITSALGI